MMKKKWEVMSDFVKAGICAGLLIIAVEYMGGGCGHAKPVPPEPIEKLCGLDESVYDKLSDEIVSSLGDDVSWKNRMTLLVTENTKAVVKCVVQNVLIDLKNAPTETNRASDWLSLNN